MFQRKLLLQVIYIWLFFSETPILTIFMAISCQATMANFNKMAVMAVLVLVDMGISMVKICVYVIDRKNVDKQKRSGKNCMDK